MPNRTAQRAAYKGQFTTLKRDIDHLSREPERLDHADTLETLLTHRQTLLQIEKQFSEVQQKIIEETPPPKQQEEEQDLSSFQAEVQAVHAKINKFIAKVEAKRMKPSQPVASGSSDLSMILEMMRQQREQDQANFKSLLESQRRDMEVILKGLDNRPQLNQSGLNDTVGGASRIKLDKVKLPTFSGDYKEWKTFKDLFVSLVDKDDTKDDAEKMYYLKTNVVGDAQLIIESLNISAENYSIAWDLLTKEFDKKAPVVASYVKDFYALSGSSTATAQGIQTIQRKSNAIVQALDALEVNTRDPFLIYSVLHKLDEETQALWVRKNAEDNPTWEEFNEFLVERSFQLRMCKSETAKPAKALPPKAATPAKKPKPKATSLAVNEMQKCGFCQQHPHKLYRCRKFLALDGAGRLAATKEMKVCENCLTDDHKVEHCSYVLCKFCNGKHNRLLHDAMAIYNPQNSGQPIIPSTSGGRFGGFLGTGASNSAALICKDGSTGTPKVLLATVMVRIMGADGEEQLCRAILDAGSQVNIISTRLCQLLQLRMTSANFLVEAVGSSVHSSQYRADVTLKPWLKNSSYTLPVNCLVMKKVTSDQPNWDVTALNVTIPKHFHLADPAWQEKQPIDLLIGGQFYWEIMKDETHLLGPGLPVMKNTVFGWVLVGPCRAESVSANVVTCNLAVSDTIECALRRFWEIEDIPDQFSASLEHNKVEEIYSSTTTRNEDGRYVVHLPFKPNVDELESNRSSALRQLYFLESRLNKNPDLREQYNNIFEDYLEKGFVEVIPFDELDRKSFYMPHHCVIKEEAVSTKVRIVFNGSARSSSGLSLNDVLMVGSPVQPPLMSTLMNFRLHPVAFTCDIVKMYLQTMLYEPHRDYQRFLWRTSSDDRVKDFRFRTVCFGVSASPHLATRSLNQLAKDEGAQYPAAVQIIQDHFYVDDCLFSAPTLHEAMDAREQLIDLLKLAQLQLSKFRSNHLELRSDPANDSQQVQELQQSDMVVKTLGMIWDARTDMFQYRVAPIPDSAGTLRLLMSTVAKIYDPLGLVCPVTVIAKSILQDIWRARCNWDMPISSELEERWKDFKRNLPDLEELRIPRWVSTITEVQKQELHCFCDASKLAYGACIYLVTEDADGGRCSQLLAAKTKVCPVKFQDQAELTIPKAELCAAELATRLTSTVSSAIRVPECYFWTDATVVLYQIHNTSRKRESFVKHRIEKIVKVSKPEQWGHVSTKENPADLASRGATPQQLKDAKVWWTGPQWISQPKESWPPKFNGSDGCLGGSLAVAECSDSVEEAENSTYADLLARFSSFHKLKRVVARCLQILSIWRDVKRRSTRSSPRLTWSKLIDVQFLDRAEVFLILCEQKQHLGHVVKAVSSGTFNSKAVFHQIRKLRPFLDADGVLRVGGRLCNSLEGFDVRHPRILPKGQLAKLIAEREHLRMLHSGPQLTLAALRQRYWPIDGRNLTRKISRNCLPCIRAKPPKMEQLMGNLPQERVENLRPFTAVGVDFAGPFWIKQGTRKSVAVKAYVAVFVCFATKAVHLELVSSLHTDSFIAAFRRFVARRGLPAKVFSDNGTTFVGADRAIRKLWESEDHKTTLHHVTSEMGIEWKFLTPRAPHQGGLYEAAVKSFKHHFVRVIGESVLTFEALTTILCQIEAVLNSRPLVPLTENPDDPTCLSPSSFLIGMAHTQLPDPDLAHLKMSHLDRWQLVQRVSQDFVKRWKREYLNTLQARNKWTKERANLREGDIVLVTDELLPSTRWPVGRVMKTYPGEDSLVRVAEVKTSSGVYRRAIQKLVRLPFSD